MINDCDFKVWNNFDINSWPSIILISPDGQVIYQKSGEGIIDLFDTIFVETNKIAFETTFKELVFQINKNEPTEAFAKKYIAQAITFFDTIEAFRAKELIDEK